MSNVILNDYLQNLIGSMVKAKRKLANQNQEGFGKYFGVSGATISRWEDGKQAVPLDVLLSLKILGFV